MTKRAVFSAGAIAIVLGIAGAPWAAPPKAPKEEVLKVNVAIKPKIDARIEPFTWGMTVKEAVGKVQAIVAEPFDKKIEKAYNPKDVANLEKQKDKAKDAVAKKVVDFKGGGGVSGYESVAPGEFTYKNEEQALEVPRAGGGTRLVFFIKDHLWKVYDLIPLGVKTNGPAEALMFGDELTFDKASDKLVASEYGGDKGKAIPWKTVSPSYFGTLIEVPQHHLWSDGKTQVRLADLTKREDMPNKSVAVVYEEIATLEKLPTWRSNLEVKAGDAQVDKAGFAAPAASSAKPKPKTK